MITQKDLNDLIKKNKNFKMELTINGEYYNSNDFKSLENAFKTNYNDTITLKINGEIKVLNGVVLK